MYYWATRGGQSDVLKVKDLERAKKNGPPSRVAVVELGNIETVHEPKPIQAVGALCMDRVAVLWSDPTAHTLSEVKERMPSSRIQAFARNRAVRNGGPLGLAVKSEATTVSAGGRRVYYGWRDPVYIHPTPPLLLIIGKTLHGQDFRPSSLKSFVLPGVSGVGFFHHLWFGPVVGFRKTISYPSRLETPYTMGGRCGNSTHTHTHTYARSRLCLPLPLRLLLIVVRLLTHKSWYMDCEGIPAMDCEGLPVRRARTPLVFWLIAFSPDATPASVIRVEKPYLDAKLHDAHISPAVYMHGSSVGLYGACGTFGHLACQLSPEISRRQGDCLRQWKSALGPGSQRVPMTSSSRSAHS
ncbi:hypothetical protein B0H11DRAFT_2196841 [Mycena galericulata]|nr:hypothetical protein B0H11DRAFT_2196841 [Mycena galericulata]